MTGSSEDTYVNGAPESLTSAEDPVTHSSGQQEGTSDGEGEKTARERLKQTSIAGLAQKARFTDGEIVEHPLTQSTSAEPLDTHSNGNSNRGRPAKKRSFEDLTRGESGAEHETTVAEPPNPKSGHHKRMRSRDIAAGDTVYSKFENEGTSPVHEESDMEAHRSPGGAGVLVDVPKDVSATEDSSAPSTDMKSTTTTDPIQTDPAELSTPASETKSGGLKESTGSSQIPASSGFANASATSPFGNVTSSTKTATTSDTLQTKATSPSAFASSGLSAFAASEKSPFGAAATKPTGGFGGPSPAGGFASSSGGFASSSGGFGGTSSFASKPVSGGFSSSTGGFGSSSSFGAATGFGTAKPFGGGMSSFAGSSGAPSSFGPSKPFGVSKDKDSDDDGSDKDEDGEDHDSQQPDAERDDRFVARDVETGEEEENTIFSARAKLYHFEKEWKERGVGTLKINIREEQTESVDEEAGDGSKSSSGTKARLIMRTDGVHRVVLNTPVFKSMQVGTSDGSEPTGKTMHLSGLENGKPRAFQIKIGKEEILKELYWKVVDLRTSLHT